MGRLAQMATEERGDLAVLIVYTVVAGLLSLAVPLAAQALVNTVAANVLLQPLTVLAGLVLAGLLLAGVLQLLKLSLVERLQQRIFARTALRMAQRLLRVRGAAFHNEYAPELVNRFFDILTIQKSLSKLLLDGFAATLQAFVGLVLLGIYSPYLLGLDLFILLFVLFLVGVLGVGGLRTSIAESREKYRVAGWLEDLARCQTGLKMHGASDYLLTRADDAIIGYIRAREGHFRVNFRQALGSYIFQALASTAVLALGGWLVINRNLTLGQLVAAQIIVVSVLAALEKLVRQADQVFDLLTGLDKTGHVTDLPVEREGGLPLASAPGGVAVECHKVRFGYNEGQTVLTGLDLTLAPGERVSLVGASGAGKSTVAALLCGLEEPFHGTILVGGVEVREADLRDLRRVVSLAGYNNEIFDGTVAENIVVGREFVSPEDVRWAVEMAQLTDDISALPGGTQTPLVSGGQNLSRGQIQRLLLARAFAGRPSLLVFDEAFTGIDERTTLKILDSVFASDQGWGILNISHDAETVLRTDRVHVLMEGRIVESGVPRTLARKDGSAFAALFPHLRRRLENEAQSSTPPVPTVAPVWRRGRPVLPRRPDALVGVASAEETR